MECDGYHQMCGDLKKRFILEFRFLEVFFGSKNRKKIDKLEEKLKNPFENS